MISRYFDRRSRRSVTRIAAWVIILCVALAGAGPAAAQTNSDHNTWTLRAMAAGRALQWLHTQQQSDGGFGVPTADAVYVIAAAGENPAGPGWRPAGNSPLDVLIAQSSFYLTDAGRTAKFLRAAAAAHEDVRDFGGVDLVAHLNSFYDPASGLYHPGQLYYSALAVQALALADQPVPAAAVTAIRNQQHASGGWEWRINGPDDEVDTTGMVMVALAAAGVPANSPTLVGGINFLATGQRADAGWSLNPTGTTNSNSTALALNGLLSAQADPLASPFVRGNTTPLDRLLTFQQPDGSFNYQDAAAGNRLMATLDALSVLLQPFPGDELPPARAYLPLAASRVP